MIFNSLEFIVFFTTVTILYFILPQKWRWLLLLSASCFFYMSFVPVYILILGFTIVVDFIAGILIEDAKGGRRKMFLFLSILANISILALFKYYNFFIENLNESAYLLNIKYALPFLKIALPIGLSFHTFQAMSYTIEVYRGRQRAERHFGIYSLYVMFFPQLVAGPIERPQNLIHQFYEKHDVDFQRISDGLKLMLWGFFKKIVIADRLAIFVDNVYAQPQNVNGLTLIIGTAFFVYQIYCDFSGYSDIAIGAAQVLGFKLMTNFNRPFHARTVAEFWKRWHISLTTWLRDYIFIPLSRGVKSKSRRQFNLFLIFLVAGIWHGANWTFILYGAINGFYILVSLWTNDWRRSFVNKIGLFSLPRVHHVIKVLTTFTLLCFSGIFFRSNNLYEAIYIVQKIFSSLFNLFESIRFVNLPISLLRFAFCLFLIAFLEFVQVKQGNLSIQEKINTFPWYFRWSFYYVLILAIFFTGVFNNRNFIYFQF
jgi:alginate O-acetyltransferase complex protein AlgI